MQSFEPAPPSAQPEPTTSDALWRGQVVLTQPRRALGYRFNLDSVLLAGFVRGHRAARAIDLGAGCGIVGTLLLKSGKAEQVTAVERQTQLLACLRHNVAQNELVGRLHVLPGDLRSAQLPAADLVVFNPPYFEAHAGRPSSCRGRDEARRECHGSLADFVAAAARALRVGGRLAAIVPYARRNQFVAACSAHALTLQRHRPVLAFAASPARHSLLEAVAGGSGPLHKQAPWVIHHPDGSYRPDVAELVRGPNT